MPTAVRTLLVLVRLGVGCVACPAGLALLAGCGPGSLPYHLDQEVRGDVPLPESTRVLRVAVPLGSITVEVGGPGAVHFEGMTRRASDTAADFAELQKLDFTLLAQPVGEPDVLALRPPALPAGLSGRSNVLVLRVSLRVPDGIAVELETERGDLAVLDRRAAVRLHTGSGDIRLAGIQGDAVAFSGRGNCMIDHHQGGLDVSTGSGTILCFLDRIGESGVRLSTREPSIMCHLPAGAGFELDAQVAWGEAVNSFGVPVTPLGERGQAMHGPVHGGGPPVHLECGRGHVSARTRH